MPGAGLVEQVESAQLKMPSVGGCGAPTPLFSLSFLQDLELHRFRNRPYASEEPKQAQQLSAFVSLLASAGLVPRGQGRGPAAGNC